MTETRKDPLVTGQLFHIYSRSIAKYKIFNNARDFDRILKVFILSSYCDFDYEFSKYFRLTDKEQNLIYTKLVEKSKKLVDIVAYCIMPTHFHLVLKQVSDDGISNFISRSLNSYSRYFNTKYQRIGPLWSSRFKNVLIEDNDQLLHLTRYIHLNPSSAGIVDKPEEWESSSYNEFIGKSLTNICNFNNLIDMTPEEYTKFVNDNKKYQRDLSLIKNLLIEDYAG